MRGTSLTSETEHRAFYRPSTDAVHMPARSRFVDAPHYYSTLFHELVHSTDHESRLARTFGERFGDDLLQQRGVGCRDRSRVPLHHRRNR